MFIKQKPAASLPDVWNADADGKARARVDIRERGLDSVPPLTWEHTVWMGTNKREMIVCLQVLFVHLRSAFMCVWDAKKAQVLSERSAAWAEKQLKTLTKHNLKSRKSRPLSRSHHVPAAQQVEIYHTGNFFPQVAPSAQDDTQASARIFKDLESRRVRCVALLSDSFHHEPAPGMCLASWSDYI